MFTVTNGFAEWFCVSLLLNEISTPFLNFRWYLLTTNKKVREHRHCRDFHKKSLIRLIFAGITHVFVKRILARVSFLRVPCRFHSLAVVPRMEQQLVP